MPTSFQILSQVELVEVVGVEHVKRSHQSTNYMRLI